MSGNNPGRGVSSNRAGATAHPGRAPEPAPSVSFMARVSHRSDHHRRASPGRLSKNDHPNLRGGSRLSVPATNIIPCGLTRPLTIADMTPLLKLTLPTVPDAPEP